MADDAPPPQQNDTDDAPQVVTVNELVPPSQALQLVLSVVWTSENNRLPLTLSIPSGIIFGHAVAPAVWFEAMAEQAAALQRGAENEPQGGEAVFQRLFNKLAEKRRAEVNDADVELVSIGYAYLVDASIVSPNRSGQPFLTQPACYQVPLDQVSAWTLGVPGA